MITLMLFLMHSVTDFLDGGVEDLVTWSLGSPEITHLNLFL